MELKHILIFFYLPLQVAHLPLLPLPQSQLPQQPSNPVEEALEGALAAALVVAQEVVGSVLGRQAASTQ